MTPSAIQNYYLAYESLYNFLKSLSNKVAPDDAAHVSTLMDAVDAAQHAFNAYLDANPSVTTSTDPYIRTPLTRLTTYENEMPTLLAKWNAISVGTEADAVYHRAPASAFVYIAPELPNANNKSAIAKYAPWALGAVALYLAFKG